MEPAMDETAKPRSLFKYGLVEADLPAGVRDQLLPVGALLQQPGGRREAAGLFGIVDLLHSLP